MHLQQPLFYNCIITNEREYVKKKKEKGYAYMMGQPNHLQGRVVQHAGEVRLGQPNKIWPSAETHRAQLTGGGSLVPPRQARRARTYLYTRLRDQLHEPL